tara:strand:- start:426 stop:893 length:468 start_codon:yes stop_codon:yes gene_type:complete
MKSLGYIVDSFSGQALKEVKISHYIKSIIIPLWGTILGKLALEFQFEHVRYRQLYISTGNPIWKSEIKYHEKMIVERLNKQLPKSLYFKGIRVFYKQQTTEAIDQEKQVKKSRHQHFKDQIQQENKRKQQLGATPCLSCSSVLTVDKVCVFCRLQ